MPTPLTPRVGDERNGEPCDREQHCEAALRRGASGRGATAAGVAAGLTAPGEQVLWWCFYLFGVSATGEWLNVTLVGPALLTLLFHGSTNFTESISLSKYPEYADYQRRVSRLVPWPAETTGSETAEAASGER